MTADLLCMGEPMLEFNQLPPNPDGSQHYLQGHGGDTSNAAVAAARHGARVGMIAAVGRDMPGDFLNSVDLAAALLAELRLPNLKLQFDIYHCQIIHGDVTTRLRKYLPITTHVQIASVPSRNEPDSEELNYPYLFRELDLLGYEGFVGCEYRPRGKTTAGLDWLTDAGGR